MQCASCHNIVPELGTRTCKLCHSHNCSPPCWDTSVVSKAVSDVAEASRAGNAPACHDALCRIAGLPHDVDYPRYCLGCLYYIGSCDKAAASDPWSAANDAWSKAAAAKASGSAQSSSWNKKCYIVKSQYPKKVRTTVFCFCIIFFL